LSRKLSGIVALAAAFSASVVGLAPMARAAMQEEPTVAGSLDDTATVAVPKERLSDIPYWEGAVASEPEDVTLHLALGNAYALNRRLSDAAAQYKQVLRIYPESKAALNNLGSVYRAMGKSNDALEAYRKALKLDPRYGLAHYNIGTIYQQQGYFDEAIQSYGQAFKYDPTLLDSKRNPQVVTNKLLFVVLLHNYVESSGSLALSLEPAYPDNPEK
jgi:tetratricopeptide (TPR) repeat protein